MTRFKKWDSLSELLWPLGAISLAASIATLSVDPTSVQGNTGLSIVFALGFSVLFGLGLGLEEVSSRIFRSYRLILSWALTSFVILNFVSRPNLLAVAAALLTLVAIKYRKALPLNSRTAPYLLLSWFSWVVSMRLLWWDTISDRFLLSALMPVIAILTIVFFPYNRSLRKTSSNWVTRITIPILLLLSFKIPSLDQAPVLLHHWGVFIGPAEVIRQGGQLYWDTPTQYGFLNILCLAFSPISSTWVTLYLINGVFFFLTSLMLYQALLRFDSGRSWFLASLLTIAVIFLLPGWAPGISGPYATPSTGPYRFFWCYAVLWSLIYNRTGFGTLFWAIGSLWSPESALFCSVIWVPGHLYSIYTSEKQKIIKVLGLHLGLAALITISTLSLYKTQVGHVPSLRDWLDYIISFSEFTTLKVNRQGPVWFSLAVFSASVLGFYLALKERSKQTPSLLGVCLFLATTQTYFFSKGEDNGVINLLPTLFLSLALVSWLSPLGKFQVFRISWAPAVALCLALSYGNGWGMKRFLSSLVFFPKSETILPHPTDESLKSLLATARISPNEPLEILEENLAPELPNPSWYPFHPLSLSHPLPLERKLVYVDRFFDRRKIGGWLAIPLKKTSPWDYTWVLENLRRTHVRSQEHRNGFWILARFDPR